MHNGISKYEPKEFQEATGCLDEISENADGAQSWQ
jgi:hypothetical protein